MPVSFETSAGKGIVRGRGKSAAGRSSSVSSQSRAAPPHKIRGPNWTEAEMLVLIGQNRLEWDGRHNCNQPLLAKFVYGTTAWKKVLAGCMSVVGFRVRDVDQITNKWDGLIKDYKKLKDYIEGTSSANWWGMSREEKKVLSKIRKMSLEFSEAMYAEMEGFVGKRQIFGRVADIVDSDRPAPQVISHSRRSTPTPREPSSAGVQSPLASTTAASESPTDATPGHDMPWSTGRKRKAVDNHNLVDFVKDFNHEYLARVEAHDIEKRTWRTDVMAFDTAREARIARKESQAANMEQKIYELEVERTKNLGNMTSTLLMLASSMDTLTRLCYLHPSLHCCPLFIMLVFSYGWQCGWHFEHEQGSQVDPPLPSALQARLFLHSRVPLALEVERPPSPLYVPGCRRPLLVGGNPLKFGQAYDPCLQAVCCTRHNNNAQL